MKEGDVVEVIDSPYPDLYPNGSRCVVWTVKGSTYIKPIGIIHTDDESDNPKEGWFKEEQLKLVEEYG